MIVKFYCTIKKLSEAVNELAYYQYVTRCVKATRMAPSQKVEKSAISILHVDTNMMVVSHIKNQ